MAFRRPAIRSDGDLAQFESRCPCIAGINVARELAPVYKETLDLRAKIAASNLDAKAKSDLLFALDVKIAQFQTALKDLLGLDADSVPHQRNQRAGRRLSWQLRRSNSPQCLSRRVASRACSRRTQA